MIATILLGAALQAAPVGSAAWKERNHPDMPVFPNCEIAADATVALSLKDIPADAAAELTRYFNTATPMSDAGGPFNSTDVDEGLPVPRQRFIRAYKSGRVWVIWYELGGRAGGPRTIAVEQTSVGRNQALSFRVDPGTALTGNLCIATKAILSGVRTAAS
jgi:hypothetical protein